MKGRLLVCAVLVAHLLGFTPLPAQTQPSEPVSSQQAPAPPTIDTRPLPAVFWWASGSLLAMLVLTSLMALALKAQLRRQNRYLQDNEARLNTILDSVDACIYIKDIRLRYTYGNRQVCERFDRSPLDLVGTTDSNFLPASVAQDMRASDLRVIQLGERVVCEEEIPSQDGSSPNIFLSIKIPLRSASGDITSLCGISTDITELRRSQAAIQRLAYYDALTKLPNRRMLQKRMEEALLAHRETGVITGLLFIDLDKFKNINDERGHEVGDAVLCAMGQRLAGLAGEGDMVARLGGDEFVVLLHDLGQEPGPARTQALSLAETIRNALAESVPIGDQSYYTGGSIGVALIDSHDKSVAEALREADTAMYHSKAAGRNRVALFHPDMRTHITERAGMLRDLVTALQAGQFELMVQPQYRRDQSLHGVELLLRWNHPVRGQMLPEQFVGLLEESGIILEVGEWVLTQACALYARLAAVGNRPSIAINISPVQLRHPDFNARLQAILNDTGTPASSIVLELTENVAIDDVHDAASRMQALADLGLRFSLDDFGTGYSGLAYLHSLPLYELKVPRLFVQNLPDKDAGTLIRLIIATARLLELCVVAEGVEEKDQAEFLAAVGCDAQQGYYHHSPVTLDAWVDACQTQGSAQSRIEQHHQYKTQHQAAGSP